MSSTVSQRTDYTFKYNQSLRRHGWLRLTPAYGVKLVENLLVTTDKDDIILDPFSGTATTGLVAAERGNYAFAFDINPFLVWFGNIKCKNYSDKYVNDIWEKIDRALVESKKLIETQNWIPQIFNIERWWSNRTLKIISSLRTSLIHQFGEPNENEDNGIVWVAFCRLIIETSSAAFNHISMSFKDTVKYFEIEYIEQLFISIISTILQSALKPIKGIVKIIQADARCIVDLNGVQIDKVVTSPPYPNRISYIRELRPYMYWTKFLMEAKEAAEIDWTAIGGTWGTATSRLNSWQMENIDLPQEVYSVVESIKISDGKNAGLMSIYVLKYFHDMHIHLTSLRHLLKDGAWVHYIVGNSTFFGNMVDTAALIAKSMKILGYKNINYEIIRKRNCKKSLYEYCVSARWEAA
ncbi:MAG: DNA methyltransferase [Rivularia sp. (in: cyanobacteria)]